ncbi:hypothetical protein ES705_35237 [subsurface metagenome]
MERKGRESGGIATMPDHLDIARERGFHHSQTVTNQSNNRGITLGYIDKGQHLFQSSRILKELTSQHCIQESSKVDSCCYQCTSTGSICHRWVNSGNINQSGS